MFFYFSNTHAADYEPFDLVFLVHNLLHLQGSELGCQPVPNVYKGASPLQVCTHEALTVSLICH